MKRQLLKYNVFIQENPARANGHIFNVGNPNNEVTVRQLAEMMTKVSLCFHACIIEVIFMCSYWTCHYHEVEIAPLSFLQVYSKVSGESEIETPTIDVSSKEFYGEGYDDSDKRIPDMTIINKQLGIIPCFWN